MIFTGYFYEHAQIIYIGPARTRKLLTVAMTPLTVVDALHSSFAVHLEATGSVLVNLNVTSVNVVYQSCI